MPKSSLSLIVLLISGVWIGSKEARCTNAPGGFVRVSARDSHYFETDDGRAYVPNGLNLISPPWVRSRDPNDRLAALDQWLAKLAANGGNHIRVWLSDEFYEVEHEKAGQYDLERAKRIDAMLAIARKHGIRVKMTIEHFRDIDPTSSRQRWAIKRLHHDSRGGLAKTMAGWIESAEARRQFIRKLEFLASRYRDDSTIYGWELWNEMNAVVGHGDYLSWTQAMLPELHRLFPHHLCMQSLGSYDSEGVRETYRKLALMPGNDVAQVHRYLDLGARLEVCHGPVDVLAASAVSTLLAARPARPVMLAESGAVEPNHSGPLKLYAKDRNGIILHDILFAPFFAGAAGSGQCWHWDQYVDANDLWWQFGRFASATQGLDPPAEGFEPVAIDDPALRVYLLKGRRTWIAWCRDKASNWKSELADGIAPMPLRGLRLDLNPGPPPTVGAGWRCRIYDPWTDHWSSGELKDGRVVLPDFTRSIVVKLER